MVFLTLVAFLILIVKYAPWKTENVKEAGCITHLAWWFLAVIIVGDVMLFVQEVIR